MMLTEAAPVDGHTVKVSFSELAALKGVSKQAISKRAERFEAEGRLSVARRGREKLVSLAEWDTAAGEVTDPAKLIARATAAAVRGEASAPAPASLDDEVARNRAGERGDPTYTEELKRKVGYEADLRELEIRRLRGELLEMTAVRDAMERCAEAMVRDIDQLATFADDLAAAVAKGGTSALRDALKGRSRQLREQLGRSMTLLAGETEAEEAA